MKDLIKFPKTGYENTGEGGLAVFFVLLAKHTRKERRQKCMGGGFCFPQQDVVISPRRKRVIGEADMAMLVASTKEALWDERKGTYFKAAKNDLTKKGLKLLSILTDIYGEEPMIVTLLDT